MAVRFSVSARTTRRGQPRSFSGIRPSIAIAVSLGGMFLSGAWGSTPAMAEEGPAGSPLIKNAIFTYIYGKPTIPHIMKLADESAAGKQAANRAAGNAARSNGPRIYGSAEDGPRMNHSSMPVMRPSSPSAGQGGVTPGNVIHQGSGRQYGAHQAAAASAPPASGPPARTIAPAVPYRNSAQKANPATAPAANASPPRASVTQTSSPLNYARANGPGGVISNGAVLDANVPVDDIGSPSLADVAGQRTYSYHYPWYFGTVAGAFPPANYEAYRAYYYAYGQPYGFWGFYPWYYGYGYTNIGYSGGFTGPPYYRGGAYYGFPGASQRGAVYPTNRNYSSGPSDGFPGANQRGAVYPTIRNFSSGPSYGFPWANQQYRMLGYSPIYYGVNYYGPSSYGPAVFNYGNYGNGFYSRPYAIGYGVSTAPYSYGPVGNKGAFYW